jgi:ParB family chromosome partitioning protein
MQYSYNSVSLARIQTEDQTFRITTQKEVGKLSLSIAAVGLLSRPLLIEKKGAYRIVSGFRRIAACIKLGWTHIKSRILAADTSSLDCIRLAVTENLHQRPLNIIEQANALNLICKAAADRSYVDIARSLGMEGNEAFFDKLLAVKRLPNSVQEAVLSETISLTTANLLGSFDAHTGKMLASLFQTLQLGLNKQREVIEMVREIAMRDGITPSQLLNGRDVQTILGDDNLDRNQKAHHIRQLLKQKRFPNLVAAENRFKQQLKALPLGENVKLVAPRFFENPLFGVHIHFQTISDLQNSLKSLREVTETSLFADIISLKDQ